MKTFNMKYQVIKEFQYTDENSKIRVLPKGTILEKENISSSDDKQQQEERNYSYIFKIRGNPYSIDSSIVENNPDFFRIIDWRVDLKSLISNKRKSPKLHQDVVQFIENNILKERVVLDNNTFERILETLRLAWMDNQNPEIIQLFEQLGYTFDQKKIIKKEKINDAF